MSFNPDPFNRHAMDAFTQYWAKRAEESILARERAERTQAMLEPLRPIVWTLDDLKLLSSWSMTL